VLHVFQNTKLFNGCYRQGLMIGGNLLKQKLLAGFVSSTKMGDGLGLTVQAAAGAMG
jgi:hypothetical protein